MRLIEDAFRQPLSERHVQALWYDSTLRPDGLRTIHGTPVKVIDPGTWNVEAGPDFQHAVLEVGADRRHLTGDVEVHLHPSDWRSHGHGFDLAYAHVVAHVTWHPRPPVGHGDGGLPAGCMHICLGDFLRTRPDFSPDEIDLSSYPYAHLPATPRPCARFFERDPDRLVATLAAAGRVRLEMKTRRLKARFVRTADHSQILYEEMMSALGYKQNAGPFRLLAETLPWRDLPADRDSALASMECAAEMTVARAIAWRRANVRPSNAPERRLETAAALFAGTASSLPKRLAACDLLSRSGQKAACSILCESGLLGARRAAAILANVLVPFAAAEERICRMPDWLFPEDVCAPVRQTAFRLLGRDHNPALYMGNGLLIQGLIHIHRECCLATRPGCENCALACSLANNQGKTKEKGNCKCSPDAIQAPCTE